MCGIAGQYLKNSISTFKNLDLNLLRHRGPDFQSYWKNSTIQLFHSRLSIIDTDNRSNQPFIDHSNRYVLIFNGEIYNYVQLKSQLNVQWRTTSDTEFLIEWLKAYGSSRLSELQGMFAFCFYDTELNTCLLSRDRFGKKPLYIFENEDQFSFASEVRVLLHMHPELRATSKINISNWLYWQTIPGNETLIDSIKQIEPGTYLFLAEGKSESSFYVFQRESNHIKINKSSVINSIKEKVENAVVKRLVSDVPFAVFLSGGIDSSIITSIAAMHLGSELNTFTLSFNEDKFSEHHFAEEIARKYRTNHHEVRLTPNDFLQLIDEGLSAMDHPSGDGLNTYVVSKFTRAHGFKMALSGIGGDEWFQGYPYFTSLDKWKNYKFLSNLNSLNGLFPFNFRKPIEICTKLELGAAAYSFQRVMFDSYSIKNWFNLPKPTLVPTVSIFPDTLSARSMQEWYYYTQPVLLRDTDQYSMAVGLELRAPLMDHQLVDFVQQLPDTFKRGRAKNLLIEAFSHLLTPTVYNRKKQGFVLPWEKWLRNELYSFSDKRIINFSNRIEAPLINDKWRSFVKGSNEITWSRWWSLVALEDYLSRNEITIRT